MPQTSFKSVARGHHVEEPRHNQYTFNLYLFLTLPLPCTPSHYPHGHHTRTLSCRRDLGPLQVTQLSEHCCPDHGIDTTSAHLITLLSFLPHLGPYNPASLQLESRGKPHLGRRGLGDGRAARKWPWQGWRGGQDRHTTFVTSLKMAGALTTNTTS